MRRVAAAALCAAAITAGVAPEAIAERAGDGDVARAREHYETGRRLYEVGEYRKALAEFRAAHVVRPDPVFLYNSAQCQRQLGERDEALTLYRRYLALDPQSPVRDQVLKRIRELEAAAPEAPPAQAPPVPVPVAVPATREVVAGTASPPGARFGETEHAGGTVTDRAERARPLHHRWWFWAGLGVAAAALTTTGLVLSRQGAHADPPCPAGVSCP